jgi:hypothetical protein
MKSLQKGKNGKFQVLVAGTSLMYLRKEEKPV